jgi:broad specificity phosphatase PhoE
MKILEVRRHSIRSQPGDHLNQEGVSLARKVGQGMGPFDYVVTSTITRAFETAIAMGFAVNEQAEILSTYGEYNVDKELPWPQAFSAYAMAMRADGDAVKYARKLAKFYEEIMNSLREDRSALAVHHGGVVEIGIAACLPDTDFEAWGGPVDYCEGARLFWEHGNFTRGELLRVPR